mgnify:CR=1 FL=1
MKLDPNSEKPLHIQAEEVLRKLIESEEYKNGKLLPNEVLLSEQLNISRNTLRQATNWYSRDYWSEKKGMVQRL